MGEIMRLFGLESKLVVYITDQGANVVKACKIAVVDRHGCVAHGLHNLITVDGISKTTELSELIDRAKDISKSFTFKGVMLENEAKDIAYEAFLDDMEHMTQMIEDDDNIRLNYDDQDETQPTGIPALNVKQTVTIKKDCPTRWNHCSSCLTAW